MLGLVGCDDPATTAEPAPQPPEPTCNEIVLALDNAAIARCPDGARFSWIVAGREVLAARTAGLVVGGVETLGTQWPEVSWRIVPADDLGVGSVQIEFRGRADLPDLSVELQPSAPAGLTVTTRAITRTALRIDALVALSGGAMPDGPVLGSAGFVAQDVAAPRPGTQAWLGGPLSVWAADRASISADGAIRRSIDADVAPAVTLSAQALWRLDPVATIGNPTPRPGIDRWGWRTGASHGAVVDINAITTEIEVLAPHIATPLVVIDGLWAPALGDWQVDDALTALDVDLGLWLPLDLVCPDAPDFAEVAALSQAPDGACYRLNPALPAARQRIVRTLPQGAALYTEGPGFCDVVVDIASVGSHPATGCTGQIAIRFDRVLGAPGAACLTEAFDGPFPRSPACQAELRALAAPADAPREPPVDGAIRLMNHIDLARVAPQPLTLSGPAGPARQRLMLAILGGAPLLIADAPSNLTPEVYHLIARAREGAWGIVQPRLDANDWPPSRWQGADHLILFNWTNAPRVVDLDPAWHGATDLLQPESQATDRVEIPPDDVRVLVHAPE